MTRVIIELVHGQFINAHFASREEATAFIGDWIRRTEERLATGNATTLDIRLLASKDNSYAMLAQYVIGMYIPQESCVSEKQLEQQKRAVDAIEKMARAAESGEDWKGE